MTKWIMKNKLYVLMSFIIVCMLSIYFFLPTTEATLEQEQSNPIELDNTVENALDSETEIDSNKQPEKMWVDIKGAVMSPGVYEVSSGERVIDAIKKAGGLLDHADEKNVNFAMKVVDEMVLYIPTIGEQVAGITETIILPFEEEGKVNINTASITELQTLPGIGESKATTIIEYRDKNGLFNKVEDIMQISGIGIKTFEKLEEHIIVK